MRSLLFSLVLVFPVILAGCGDESSSTADLTQVDAGPSPTLADAQGEEGDACWWCSDADAGGVPETLEGTGGGGKGEGGGKDGGGSTYVWTGTVDLTTLKGTYVTQLVGGESKEEPAVTCEVSQPITGGAPRDDCAACVFAYDLTMEIAAGDDTEGCEDFDMQVTSLPFGHGDDGIYGFKDEAWSLYGEDSTVSPNTWTFQFTYYLGGGGKDDDGKGDDGKGGGDKGGGDDKEGSETCYYDCIAKGATEAECEQTCGAGDDAGDDDDGK